MQYSVTNHAWSDTGNPDTSERLKRVVGFLQFLTTPANCDRVVNEQIALLPNIKGVQPHPELLPFDRILQRHYSMTKWFFTFDIQWDQVLMRMLELYLNNGIDQAQYLNLIEKDIERTTRRIVKRKDLDVARFEQVWDSRKAMRGQFSELPDDAK
jgi:hypothetical protein